MLNKVDRMLEVTAKMFREHWSGRLSGQERICFLVFDPAELRKVELRFDEFVHAAHEAGRRWVEVSLKPYFPEWMAAHEYREEYFAAPEFLMDQLETEFKAYVIERLTAEIAAQSPDENTVIALRDTSALFGLQRLSDVLQGVAPVFMGRVLVFFPGEFENNQYRLLSARDGWSYLARPLLPDSQGI